VERDQGCGVEPVEQNRDLQGDAPGGDSEAVSPAVILRTEENKDAAIRRIKAIKPDQEKPMGLWIGPYKKIRTLAQNALYWKRIGLIVAATGHSKKALHEYFKEQAWGKVVEEVDGKVVEFTRSSAAAERGDFSELIEYVEQFIAEHSLEEAA
jgi:hypothetical protein